tara:strand:+ start:5649 stop:6959 length:1311 start_codon:yes stop_codon:yes gene_type:complete
MNLGQIIDRCGNILDYSPALTSYRQEVRDIVNMVYLELFGERPFQFAQKTTKITAYPDAKPAGTAITLTGGSNDVICAGLFATYMNGMILEVQGSTTANNNGEYIIRHVSTTDRVYVENEDGSTPSFTADATTAGNANLTLTVKHRYVDLPQDCIAPLAVGIRTPGSSASQPMDYLTMYLDEAMNLDLDEVSRPTDFIHMSPVSVNGPPKAPTVASAGGGSPVPAGTYDAVYTIMVNGRESSASPVSAYVTLGVAAPLQSSDLLLTGANTGRVKKVYVRGPNSDAFYYVAQVAVGTTDTAGTIALATNPHWLTDRNTYPKLPENDGLYTRLRMYPRQDAEYSLTVRYLFRPEKLLDESDIPVLPAANHIYLVYRTCQELFSKHNNMPQSQMYQLKADRELQNLMNRYLSQKTATYIKGAFRSGSLFQRPMPVLTHS